MNRLNITQHVAKCMYCGPEEKNLVLEQWKIIMRSTFFGLLLIKVLGAHTMICTHHPQGMLWAIIKSTWVFYLPAMEYQVVCFGFLTDIFLSLAFAFHSTERALQRWQSMWKSFHGTVAMLQINADSHVTPTVSYHHPWECVWPLHWDINLNPQLWFLAVDSSLTLGFSSWLLTLAWLLAPDPDPGYWLWIDPSILTTYSSNHWTWPLTPQFLTQHRVLSHSSVG